MSSTFEWKAIVGVLLWGPDWMAGPSGQTSRLFFAESGTQTGPELEPDDEDDEEPDEPPPKPSSVAAPAILAAPITNPKAKAWATTMRPSEAKPNEPFTRFIVTSRTST
jgi:hypothetical protein